MNRLTIPAACLVLLLNAGTAAAEPRSFDQVDANIDGFLDQQEFTSSGAELRFADFDANEDQRISKKEYNDKLQECE